MTPVEAQQLVRSWQRVLIPWAAAASADTAHTIERTLIGLAVGPLPAMLLAQVKGVLSFEVVLPVAAMMMLSYCMSLKFRAAHRVLWISELSCR
jgi:hypothetical protein